MHSTPSLVVGMARLANLVCVHRITYSKTCTQDLNDDDFYPALRAKLTLEKEIGLQYINFHIRLPPHHLHAGGEYREDGAYHRVTGERLVRIQEICFEAGLNCYFETHMNMISEDPVGMKNTRTFTQRCDPTLTRRAYVAAQVLLGSWTLLQLTSRSIWTFRM